MPWPRADAVYPPGGGVHGCAALPVVGLEAPLRASGLISLRGDVS
ncbi:MAG TPA: hypothetical protein VF546_19290 [Pyrinomonadaceae bacterium]